MTHRTMSGRSTTDHLFTNIIYCMTGEWHRGVRPDDHRGAGTGGGLHQALHEHRHQHHDQEAGQGEARRVLVHGAARPLRLAVHRRRLPRRQLRLVLRRQVQPVRVERGGRREQGGGDVDVHHLQHHVVLARSLNAAGVWYIAKVGVRWSTTDRDDGRIVLARTGQINPELCFFTECCVSRFALSYGFCGHEFILVYYNKGYLI